MPDPYCTNKFISISYLAITLLAIATKIYKGALRYKDEGEENVSRKKRTDSGSQRKRKRKKRKKKIPMSILKHQ